MAVMRQRAAAACRRELELAPRPSVATAVALVPGEGLARAPDDG